MSTTLQGPSMKRTSSGLSHRRQVCFFTADAASHRWGGGDTSQMPFSDPVCGQRGVEESRANSLLGKAMPHLFNSQPAGNLGMLDAKTKRVT